MEQFTSIPNMHTKGSKARITNNIENNSYNIQTEVGKQFLHLAAKSSTTLNQRRETTFSIDLKLLQRPTRKQGINFIM